jgi:hypothetical protein
MEAILDFRQGCQNLSIILWGGKGEGGVEMAGRPAALVITFEGGVGGGDEERGRSKHVLVLNAAICIYSISFSCISVLLLQPLSI